VWHLPVIPVFEKQRKKDGRLRPAWATTKGHPVSKEKRKEKPSERKLSIFLLTVVGL
jgi:hypothetical protein